MDIGEFVDMLKAIEDKRPFRVGFQLQWSAEGDLTLENLISFFHPKALRVFMEKVKHAEPPIFD